MQSKKTGRPSGNYDNPEALYAAAPSSAPTRTAREARADGGRIGAEPGAQFCNTAPDNCNGQYFKALRWGVDSLYLSYTGELHPKILARLQALKAMAQSKADAEVAQAQYPIDGHIFEVLDRGAKRFPFILTDGDYRIQLGRGGKLPVAFVQVSASLLAHIGPVEVEKRLYAILSQLGDISAAHVSRIDLFVDFVWNGSFEWSRESWVTRAGGIDTYSENGIFTGWVVGRGGVMLARLYYKLLQAAKVGADYLLDLWQKAGWHAGEQVWRLEFQIKAEVLKQMGLSGLPAVLDNLSGLWSYATTEWLKLALPQAADKTRSRWPVHPLWGYLASVDWEGNGGPLTRNHNATRVPEDKKLLAMLLSSLLGFMAKRDITDLYQGQDEAMAELVSRYEAQAKRMGLSFEDFIETRLALKVRRYNMDLNNPRILADLDREDLAAAIQDYQDAKGGA